MRSTTHRATRRQRIRGAEQVLTFDSKRRIGTNEHGDGARTTSGTAAALGVDGNVTANDDRVAAVPRGGLNPVDRVEERSGGTIASVLGVDALNVSVAGLGEVVHEMGLSRLRLVNDSLRADVNAANGLGVNVVLFDEARHGWDARAE